jgi:uncharacterized protein with HEPN domain
MQPDERDAGYLWDMLEAAREVVQFTRGISFAAYVRERMRQRAVERAVEIIGEAARRVSSPFRAAHPEIPWRQIIAQRNVLAHEYGEVLQEKVWRVAVEHIPALVAQLEPLVPPIPE